MSEENFIGSDRIQISQCEEEVKQMEGGKETEREEIGQIDAFIARSHRQISFLTDETDQTEPQCREKNRRASENDSDSHSQLSIEDELSSCTVEGISRQIVADHSEETGLC